MTDDPLMTADTARVGSAVVLTVGVILGIALITIGLLL